MSRSEREKGARGERECVELLTAHGLDAERTFYQPGSKKADVDSLAGRFEVKIRAKFVAYEWLHDDVRGIYVRADRKPALIILRAEDAANLFRIEKEALVAVLKDKATKELAVAIDQVDT